MHFVAKSFQILKKSQDNKVFCQHGGLSPHIDTLDQARELDRWVFII